MDKYKVILHLPIPAVVLREKMPALKRLLEVVNERYKISVFEVPGEGDNPVLAARVESPLSLAVCLAKAVSVQKVFLMTEMAIQEMNRDKRVCDFRVSKTSLTLEVETGSTVQTKSYTYEDIITKAVLNKRRNATARVM